MKIIKDKKHSHLFKDARDVGFTRELASRIDFSYGDSKDKLETRRAFIEILRWMESIYKVYKDNEVNSVTFGEHDLFYWGVGLDDSFFITVQDIDSKKKEAITEEIINYISTFYKNVEGRVFFHFRNEIDWQKMNEYISETEFDILNLPFNHLSIIRTYSLNFKEYLSEENKFILRSIEDSLHPFYLSTLEEKRVYLNGNEGTIKKVADDKYAFFKLRAKTKYEKLTLLNIKCLTIKK